MTDIPVTGTLESDHLVVAEQAREVYSQARADRRLRRILSSNLPSGAEDRTYPSGTKVAYWRERTGARQANYRGPAVVIGYDSEGRYVLSENGRTVHSDRAQVRIWPEQNGDDKTPPVQDAPKGPTGKRKVNFDLEARDVDALAPTAEESEALEADKKSSARSRERRDVARIRRHSRT